MPILAKVAIRHSAPSQARLQAVVLLVEAVVSVAVLVVALREALFGVVGGHDCCDGEDHAGCDDDFDDGYHCCCVLEGGWGDVGGFVVEGWRDLGGGVWVAMFGLRVDVGWGSGCAVLLVDWDCSEASLWLKSRCRCREVTTGRVGWVMLN
jgi:hypothetical protein